MIDHRLARFSGRNVTGIAWNEIVLSQCVIVSSHGQDTGARAAQTGLALAGGLIMARCSPMIPSTNFGVP